MPPNGAFFVQEVSVKLDLRGTRNIPHGQPQISIEEGVNYHPPYQSGPG
jgi:hypothetical protein